MKSLGSPGHRVDRLLPVVSRVVAVTVTLYPAVRKFTEYPHRVSQFETYGMPWPELAVPVTGLIELVAIVSIGFGIAGRLGGGALALGMVVAIVAAGPNPFSVLVLLASVGIVLTGTGPYSYWDPTLEEVLAGPRAVSSSTRARGDGE